jgi:hypothetical protein
MPVFEDGRWKIWVAVASFVIVVGFALRQYQSGFVSHPPDWMHVQEHESQRIPDLHEIDSAWRKVTVLWQMTRAAAASQQVANYTIMLTELASKGPDATAWQGETIRNQGFEPLSRIERELWGTDPARLLGYYTSDGLPLRFATRNNPSIPGLHLVTVHLDGPMAPAASTFLIRRERQPNSTPLNGTGPRTFGFNYFRQGDGVEACGVLLPPRATLVRYSPEPTAIVMEESPTAVAWIISDPKATMMPLSITYMPR